MVEKGKKKEKKEKKRKEDLMEEEGSRMDLQEILKSRKKKKNKILNFAKLKYYKYQLPYYFFNYTQILGQPCHASDSSKNSIL